MKLKMVWVNSKLPCLAQARVAQALMVLCVHFFSETSSETSFELGFFL